MSSEDPPDSAVSLTVPPIPWIPEVSAANPVDVYLSGLGTDVSRREMRLSLVVVARLLTGRDDASPRTFPWHTLRYEVLLAVRTKLAERYAPSSANRHLSAVRGVLREAFRLGQMPADAWSRTKLVGVVRGTRPPAGRALTRPEVAALIGACDAHTAVGRRDRAAFALLYGCGLRRAELLGVRVDDISLVRGTVLVRGKGNKTRVVPMPPGTCRAVGSWLGTRGTTPGPLIVSLSHCSARELAAHAFTRPLDARSLAVVLRRVARRAGVPPFTPHDLRRTYASHLLDAGADLAQVKSLLGHAQLATTEKYDRRADESASAAARKLHVPFGEVAP